MTKERDCGRKVRHTSREKARQHFWELVRSGAKAGSLSVYRCKHCGHWHVGHRKRRRR